VILAKGCAFGLAGLQLKISTREIVKIKILGVKMAPVSFENGKNIRGETREEYYARLARKRLAQQLFAKIDSVTIRLKVGQTQLPLGSLEEEQLEPELAA
jgi:hypothetical protein